MPDADADADADSDADADATAPTAPIGLSLLYKQQAYN